MRGGKKFVAVGECMAELSPLVGSDYRLSFAGDTLNTAWYVQLTAPSRSVCTDFVSAVGRDDISSQMISFISSHGIGTDHIARLENATVGLYLIALEQGERSFSYWRGQSAAKQLAHDRQRLKTALADADLVYFSGVTLAILDPIHRRTLLEEIRACRERGAIVAFDSNVRLSMWPSLSSLKDALEEAYRIVDIALPTYSDELAIFDDATEEALLTRIRGYGVGEIVAKHGESPCTIEVGGARAAIAANPVTDIVDTTGAGDSFNGAYLVSRLVGKTPHASVEFAHRVAAAVIQKKGALLTPEDLSAAGIT